MHFSLFLTPHAVVRAAQRGIREDDLQLIMSVGTEVEGGILVRERDYLAIEQEVKSRLTRLRRLIGKRLVFEGDALITAYHARPAKVRRLLRERQSRVSGR